MGDPPHLFRPGIAEDSPTPDWRWCDTCGETLPQFRDPPAVSTAQKAALEAVEHVLIYHRLNSQSQCHCGHQVQLGASRMRHRAELIVDALAAAGLLRDAPPGAQDADLRERVRATLGSIAHRRAQTGPWGDDYVRLDGTLRALLDQPTGEPQPEAGRDD